MTVLGLIGFFSDWIEDYAIEVALRAIINATGTKIVSAQLEWASVTLIDLNITRVTGSTCLSNPRLH